jgi:hypothetical protein
MAIVLDGFVFSAFDPADIGIDHWSETMSPLGLYTLGFLLFWSVIACASAMTAMLFEHPGDIPAP